MMTDFASEQPAVTPLGQSAVPVDVDPPAVGRTSPRPSECRRRSSHASRLAILLLGSLAALAGARELRPHYAVRVRVTPPETWQHDAVSTLDLNVQPDGRCLRVEVALKVLAVRPVAADGTVGPVSASTPRKASWQTAEGELLHVRRWQDILSIRLGESSLRVAAPDLNGGEVAVASTPGGPRIGRPSVQPLGPITFSDDFMREEDETGAWEARAGTWTVDQLPNATWSSNAFRYLARGKDRQRDRHLVVAGKPFWDSYACRAAIRPGRDSRYAGISFGVVSSDGYRFEWRTGHPRSDDHAGAAPGDPGQLLGRFRLVRWSRKPDGAVHENSIAETEPLRLDPDQWTEFAVAVDEGRVTCFVDSRPIFSRDCETTGRIGLEAGGSRQINARFDDVAVASLPASSRSLDTEARTTHFPASVIPPMPVQVAERFRTDRYMQQWASELGSWVRNGRSGTYRHIGLFPDDVTLSWEADETVPLEQGPLAVHLLPVDNRREPAYTLEVRRDGPAVRLALARAGKAVAEESVNCGKAVVGDLAVDRHGAAFSVTVNKTTVDLWTDPEPLPTRALEVTCPWMHTRTLHYFSAEHDRTSSTRLPAVQDLAATCPQLRDYLFHRAPTDWFADTGIWEVTARWICLPMFSWLGGRSHGNAIFWNKHAFAGDMVVDMHAAVMMNYGPMSGYDHYGDLAVSICTDGKDLSSGYTVQFGAEGNTVSRILRKGKVVAENHDVLYPPRSEGAHQNWYHLTVRKDGDSIAFLVDNKPVCNFTDPEPLSGGHAALWTWNRGMMVARARIWAEQDRGVKQSPFLRPASAEMVQGIRRQPPDNSKPVVRHDASAGIPEPSVTSSTHPGEFFPFDTGVGRWGTRDLTHGVAVRHETDAGNGWLTCTNVRTGGDMSCVPPIAELDAAELQQMAFDARFDPEARVNLYFRAFDRWHVVPLTGSDRVDQHQITESREISGRVTGVSGLQLEAPPPVILDRADVAADGEWHHVTIRLLDILEARYPGHNRYRIRDMHFGNWSNRDYAACGFTGNRVGTAYSLDNVWFGTPGRAEEATFICANHFGSSICWRADRSPHLTSPLDAAGAAETASVALAGLAPGVWYLHSRSLLDRRKPWQAAHFRFVVDAQAPAIAETVPEDGVAAGPDRLHVTLSDPGAAGLSPRSVAAYVQGDKIPTEHVSVTRTGPDTVEVEALLAGRTFADGEEVACRVEARDRAGNGLAGTGEWSWTFSQANDRVPPSLPHLLVDGTGEWREGFELPSDEWGAFPGSAWSEAVQTGEKPAEGTASLRVRGGPGPYRCHVRRTPFDVASWPVLTFRYRADASAVWDLAVETDLGWSVVAVNGGTRLGRTIGRLPAYRADGDWHTVVIPLGTWLEKGRRYRVPVVRAIAVTADRMVGGMPVQVDFDAFDLGPALFRRAGTALAWRADDIGGISHYLASCSRKLDAPPETRIAAASASWTFDRAFPGIHYLQCRAVDRAGNRGPVLSQPFLIRTGADETPPTVKSVTPAAGTTACTDRIEAMVSDDVSGISVEGVVLEVSGRRYTFRDRELTVDPAGGTVTWRRIRGRETTNQPAFPLGTTVTCRLYLRDNAGNAVAEPHAWSWTADAAADTAAPEAPTLSWRPGNALMAHDYEFDVGQCIGRREGWSHPVETTAATGLRSMRFGGFSTFLCHARFDAAEYPLIGFSYCFPEGAQANLMVRIENRNWEIRFNARGLKYPAIGTVPGIVADGTWRHCIFNVAEMLQNASVPPRTLLVDHIAALNRRGEEFFVDDVFVASPRSDGVRVAWAPVSDASGIVGYSFVYDNHPDTVPDATVDTTDCHTSISPLPASGGYIHVRAIDGAGNPGSPAHRHIALPQ